MLSIKDILIREAENEVKAAIETNKPQDMFHLEESPLPWKKIAKLDNQTFAKTFSGKSLIVYVPATSIPSMFGGKFARAARSTGPDSGIGFYTWQNSVIVISDINQNTCQVWDIEITPRALHGKYSHHHSDDNFFGTHKFDIPTTDVIKSIGALGLKKLSQNGGSKAFVISNPHFTGYNKGNFTWGVLLKPFYDVIDKFYTFYDKKIDAMYAIFDKCRDIADVTKLRKGATWNYMVDARKKYGDMTIAVVGYDKAFEIRHGYSSFPQVNNLGVVSVSYFYEKDVVGHNTNKGLPGKKINDKHYEKAKAIVNEIDAKLKEMGNEFVELHNRWVDEFMLGKKVDFDKLDNEAEEKAQELAAKGSADEKNKVKGIETPEEAEKIEVSPDEQKPEKEMPKKANAAAYDKMKAWHEGTRKQNLKNCSDDKLKMNYKVCKKLGYEDEMKQIEAEAKSRNIVLESVKLSIEDYVSIW